MAVSVISAGVLFPALELSRKEKKSNFVNVTVKFHYEKTGHAFGLSKHLVIFPWLMITIEKFL